MHNIKAMKIQLNKWERERPCKGSPSCTAKVDYPKLGLCRYCYDVYGIGDTYGKEEQE